MWEFHFLFSFINPIALPPHPYIILYFISYYS